MGAARQAKAAVAPASLWLQRTAGVGVVLSLLSQNHIWGLCSQDLHLAPGAPSCSEGCEAGSRQAWRDGVLTERRSCFKRQFFFRF